MSIGSRAVTSFSLADPIEPRFTLAFCLGGKFRGLAGDRIVRVAEIHRCSPLPSDLRCNLGLVVHRGVVAGLLDLELLERLNAADGQEHSEPDLPTAAPGLVAQPSFFCVFARFPRGVAGFPVDDMPTLVQRSRGISVADSNASDADLAVNAFNAVHKVSPMPLAPNAPTAIDRLPMVDLDRLEVFA